MRRLVGISARSAVAVALPLVGAIYLAAEAREAMIRRYSEESSLNPVGIQQSPISQPEDRSIGASDHRAIGPSTGASAGFPQQKDAFQTPTASDEVAAEQQAAQIPQKPTEDPAEDLHMRQIIISIPDRQLALLEDGQLVKVYPVAVGRSETPSPGGEFTIINHAVNPTYRHEGKEIGPGKDNPLGTRWMGLSLKGYGIHGTNVQSSVGKAASHGCFRMKKKDVEELYRRVQVGDAVSVRGERDLFASDKNAGKPETEIASVATVNASAGGDQ